MLRQFCAFALLAAMLTGCVETLPNAPGDASGVAAPGAIAPASSGLQISDMTLASRTVTAAEAFGVTFKVRTPGAGKLVAYGLATRLGEQRYEITTPLPVIANGMVELGAAGPLPNQREAGRFTVEFWVEDALGATSNRLTADLNVQ